MADLASTDVTLTKIVKHRVGLLKQRIHQVAFGNGALTYPSGGVPLPALSYFELDHVDFFDLKVVTINGLTYKYDKTNHKIRIFQSAGFTPAGTNSAPAFTGSALGAHPHDIKLIGGITATEPVAVQGGDTLGKNAATDRTIAGADSATKGGVVGVSAGTPAGTVAAPTFTGTAVAAAALVELGNVAVAAVVLLLKLEAK
jgi:hypothetical protein